MAQPQERRPRGVPVPLEDILDLGSAALEEGEPIPELYTADGDDVSPPLEWDDPPGETASFAVLCEDEDAPSANNFTHWILWNIDAAERRLEEAIPATSDAFDYRQGENDFGRTGWNGPAPPPGSTHEYVIRLYALDTRLDLPAGSSRRAFDVAIQNHVVAESMLTFTYGR